MRRILAGVMAVLGLSLGNALEEDENIMIFVDAIEQ